MNLFKSMIMLLSILLLVSCTNSSLVSDNNPPSSEDVDQRDTIEFWHTYSDIETKVFEEHILPLFEQEYPNIKIHATRLDYTDQLKNNILASVADNKQPDVMRIDIKWVPELAKYGVLAELSELEDFNQLKERFIGFLLSTNEYHGKYYGLPVNATTKAAVYNLKLLKEAGLSEPPSTFDELIQAVKYLQTKHSDVYGIGICCTEGWGTLPYFWTLGGNLTDDKFTKTDGYLNSEASIRAITTLKMWYDQRIIGPSILRGEPGNWDGVLKGKLLMIDEAHWFHIVNSTGDNKDLLKDTIIAKFPSGVRAGTSIIGGENLIMFKDSKQREQAWTFMKWMMTEQPQKILAETGLIPTIKDVVNNNPMFTPYLEQLNNALPRPPVSVWDDMDKVYTRMMERILTNEQPIKAAIDEAVLKIDAMLLNQ
ncbi:extracellular solute-binding protein [Paenibacillus psychroresistens]|uniref:Extracellular solute-binding protein n=1 Tax=Paenibacillus psychroresistens TaxID=1778678 RepID=A0A6B8RR05_9BACL|nr:extracellular solute-binding protein [Paenibacillus psychroresistens]QGQ97975.1 extracellular solute-binding protein [Paenibacillus psychroresistens]